MNTEVTFDHKELEAADISTFYFKPLSKFEYTAGQFIELEVPHKKPDNRGIKRWFSLSSSPTDELLTITTKQSKLEGSTFKKALFKLEPGSSLNIRGPMGDFVLPKMIQTPLIFVAGGIGITPVHSIAKWLMSTNESRPVKLLYGVKSENDIIFQDTFKKASIHTTILVNEPSPAWGGERGSLSAELIIGLSKPTENNLIYLSGPDIFMRKLERDLTLAGIRQDHLVLDFFHNYPTI